MKRFGKGFIAGVVLVLFAVVALAARYETFDVTNLLVKNIKRLSENHALTIGESDYNTKVVNGIINSGWYSVGTSTGTTTHTLTSTISDWILINKATGLESLTVNLPTITSDLDGKLYIFKQLDSGTTACNVTPTAGSDAIETSQGTLTGVSDFVLDAAGDCKGWKAHYRSGASPVWLLIHDDVS